MERIIIRKFTVPLTMLAMLTLNCSSWQALDEKDPIDTQVARLLSKMTLEEKVGQMTQVTLEVVAGGDKNGYLKLDAKKLRQAGSQRKLLFIPEKHLIERPISLWN